MGGTPVLQFGLAVRNGVVLVVLPPSGSRKGSQCMLEAFALSDKGCVRTNNEDYCLIEPELGLYVLADGMGGAKAGECASRLAVDTVAEIIFMAHRRDSQVLL